MSSFAGRDLEIDQVVLDSERATNGRNEAMARLIVGHGRLYFDPDESTDVYTRLGSLMVTAVDLAMMGATLADGGVNPVTLRRVVSPDTCRRTLAVMLTAGLYELSGDWLYEIGLPAKSGVSGGIVTVAPGKGGLATFSPPLDAAGNSVRGQLVTKLLSEALGLDLLASQAVRGAGRRCKPDLEGPGRRRPPAGFGADAPDHEPVGVQRRVRREAEGSAGRPAPALLAWRPPQPSLAHIRWHRPGGGDTRARRPAGTRPPARSGADIGGGPRRLRRSWPRRKASHTRSRTTPAAQGEAHLASSGEPVSTSPRSLYVVAATDFDSEIKQLQATMKTIGSVLDLDGMRKEIADLGEQVAVPDLWDDQANAQRVTGRLSVSSTTWTGLTSSRAASRTSA